MQAEDWLYMDGEDAGASEFQNRLETLKSTWKALFIRLTILLAGYNVLVICRGAYWLYEPCTSTQESQYVFFQLV